MSITKYKRGIPTYTDSTGNKIGLICETKEECITDNSGVSLENKLQNILDGTAQVGNAKTLDGHGAEYFAPLNRFDGTENLSTSVLEKAVELGRGIYTYHLTSSYNGGDLPDSNYRYSTAYIEKWGTNDITVRLNGVYAGSKDYPPIYNRYVSGTWQGWKTFATTDNLANYLPLVNGGKPIVKTKSNDVIIFDNTADNPTYSWIDLRANGEDIGAFGFSQGGIPLVWTNGGGKQILHTGNKPSGSYTGNGSTTERTINTGGTGNVVVIYSSYGVAIVTTAITILISSTGSVTTTKDVGFASDGGILIKTNNNIVNGSGTIRYTYV